MATIYCCCYLHKCQVIQSLLEISMQQFHILKFLHSASQINIDFFAHLGYIMLGIFTKTVIELV